MKLTPCLSKMLCLATGCALALSSLGALASNETKIGRSLSPQGDLESVVVMTNGLLFYVSPTGRLQKVTPDPNATPTQRQKSTDNSKAAATRTTTAPTDSPALKTQYSGHAGMPGGRQLTEVNGIKITYYSNMGQQPMGIQGIQKSAYGRRSAGAPFYNGTSLAQSVRDQNFSAAPGNPTTNARTKKVRSIGDVQFTYYNNNRSGNAGKINRVGDYRIIYYSRDGLTGRAGKVRSFSKQ